jgi:hypothetical protein
MTAKAIWREVKEHKPVTLRQVQNYIRICGIQTIGLPQRPPQYPDDSAEIILRRLGISNGKRAVA